jgi:glutaredoxin
MSKGATECPRGSCRIDPERLRAVLAAGTKKTATPGAATASKSVLVFTRAHCPVCAETETVLNTVAAGREGIAIVNHDLDTAEGLVEGSLHNALSVPTIIVIDHGKETARWESRAPSPADLRAALGI